MIRTSLTLAGLVLAGTSSYGQEVSYPSMATNARQVVPHVFPPSAPVGGSDSCTTPDLIVGTGTFAFDTTAATTGTSNEGQVVTNCIFYSLQAIANDVWFTWVAPSTGTYEFSTCGQTAVDTKIAAYGAPGCPVAASTAAGCADDINGAQGPGNFQSRVTFTATVGQTFMFQIGEYPNTSPVPTPPFTQGPGTFTILQTPVQDPFIHDAGVTQGATRVGGATTATTLVMVVQGTAATGLRTVTSVDAAVGGLAQAAVTLAVNGATIQLGVWEDPNDDGNPNDAVLLTSPTLTALASNVNTDTIVTYPIPPVQVNGGYFVGFSYNHGANIGFPFGTDVTGCAARPGQSWMIGNAATSVDMANLTANSAPPFNPGGALNTLGFLIRSTSTPTVTGTLYCFGDGAGLACPCGNNSVVGANEGCLHSLAVAGKFRATGNASVSADTLQFQGTQLQNAPGLYFQGTTQLGLGNGVIFGDGIRCVGGSVIRLGIVTAISNASTYPSPNPPAVNAIPVSLKGLVAAGDVRNYQLWFRDSASFCNPQVFNLTNALNLTWTP